MPDLNETILEDDFPVYWDYLYVADGKLIQSNVSGTIKDLKRDLQVSEIKSCDIEGRRKLLNIT